ncbi:hypothetical protein [Blastopirellula marina]|uniref:hypothetical protein n=1 Tax=Blastopirellula marina TaxID=124 RepID=UPI0013048BB5|nr:hypothetical protein [Blastopirellula marina]
MRFYLVLFVAAALSILAAAMILRWLLPWFAMLAVVLFVVACLFAARRISKPRT